MSQKFGLLTKEGMVWLMVPEEPANQTARPKLARKRAARRSRLPLQRQVQLPPKKPSKTANAPQKADNMAISVNSSFTTLYACEEPMQIPLQKPATMDVPQISHWNSSEFSDFSIVAEGSQQQPYIETTPLVSSSFPTLESLTNWVLAPETAHEVSDETEALTSSFQESIDMFLTSTPFFNATPNDLTDFSIRNLLREQDLNELQDQLTAAFASDSGVFNQVSSDNSVHVVPDNVPSSTVCQTGVAGFLLGTEGPSAAGNLVLTEPAEYVLPEEGPVRTGQKRIKVRHGKTMWELYQRRMQLPKPRLPKKSLGPLIKYNRKSYTVANKLKMVELFRSEATTDDLRGFCLRHDLNRKMFGSWIKAYDTFKLLKRGKRSLCRLRQRKAKFPELEERLQYWVRTERSFGKLIQQNDVQERAKQLSAEMGISGFLASPSWLRGFSARTRVVFRKPRVTVAEPDVEIPSEEGDVFNVVIPVVQS